MNHFEKSPLVKQFGASPAWLIANDRKAPCDRSGRPLNDWNNPDNLHTFTDATALMNAQACRVGVYSAALPALAMFDLDDCLNAGAGVIDPVALWLLGYLNTYTEVTPSGMALRAYALVDGAHEPINKERKTTRSMGVFDMSAGAVVTREFNFSRGIFYGGKKFVVHTGNPYHWLLDHAPIMTLATITPEVLDLIAAAFWLFDRAPQHDADAATMRSAWRDEQRPAQPAKGGAIIEPAKAQASPAGDPATIKDFYQRVIDEFNKRTNLREVMNLAGYTFSKDGRHFARPNKKLSAGASGVCDGDRAYTFSSNDPLAEMCEKGYQIKAFDVVLEFDFDGNLDEAVTECAKKLGIQRPRSNVTFVKRDDRKARAQALGVLS